jgi:hypothetical protein
MTLQRALTLIAGLIVAVVALGISIVAVALLAVVGSLVFGYYWWKTRDLRRELKARIETAHAARAAGVDSAAQNGMIIEGEWQRDGEVDADAANSRSSAAPRLTPGAVLPAPTFATSETRAPEAERR